MMSPYAIGDDSHFLFHARNRHENMQNRCYYLQMLMDTSIEANLRYIFGEMVRKLTKYWEKEAILSQEKSCIEFCGSTLGGFF